MPEQERFQSEEGICTSLAFNDLCNYLVIQTVLGAYLQGELIQSARRGTDIWVDVQDMPMDFNSFMFRKVVR